ncbi:MAG: bifunctional glutamate N-acetyltransferase/amino-acid acetyltransferase ArgJ [Planctomycetota bacterium]
MEKIEGGGVLTAQGFRAGAARCGMKQAEGEPDVALVVSDEPAAAAGVFTTNRFAAAPVRWCRRRLPTEQARAVVVNAGNANACTGEQGRRDVRATAELVGELAGCAPEAVCIASTGIIGHPLPMDRLTDGVRAAWDNLTGQKSGADLAARAIMTTDTRPKACAVASETGGISFRVGGMAKGAGMIAPHMATMLCVITTDVAIPAELLRETVREVADCTFNRVTVDGDTSTNDSALVLAGGASGAAAAPGAGLGRFTEALEAVMADLSARIARDGEGATKLLEVRVGGARSPADAERAARAVGESQLVKCAVYGGDPNWGRIVCALGYSGAQVEPEATSVRIGDVCVFEQGKPTGRNATEQMAAERVVFEIDLGQGRATATVLSCDLTEEYVRINAEYHT